MRILRYVVFGLLVMCLPSYAAINRIAEEDGSPSMYPWEVRVPNNSLTNNGNGTASLDWVGGSLLTTYLKLDGSNANTNINIGTYNLTTTGTIAGINVTSGADPGHTHTAYVTSVTGTAPVASSGGTTPAISMAAATSTVDGYLTSADWSTFNSKQATISVTTPITLTGASVGMVNQGTTTTVLHGNAAGNPSFGTVDISADTNLAATSPIVLTDDTLSHATTAGNIHLPTGGVTNQILKNSGASGTGAWGTVTENAGALAAITTITMGASNMQELTVIGDVTISDAHPNIVFRNSGDNTAMCLHSNINGANDPWGVFQLWRGTDVGGLNSFAVSPNIPLMWWDNSNDAHFSGQVFGNVTGALTGNADTATTASTGDAALDFFGAGVTAVTDATACTDIEGTALSITAGVLNVTETDPNALLTAGTDNVKDTHIDWGTGAAQVSAVDIPIADAGVIITATEVEGALQENRTAINLNTAKETNATHTGEVTGATALTIADGVAVTNWNLTTPTLGVASATSINKVALTAPATNATITIAEGKTLTASNTLILSGTDGTKISGLYSKSFIITNPTATADGAVWRVPYAITITAIHVLCVDGTNIIGGLDEADGNGLNPVAVDVDITGTAGTNVNDDGSLTNPSIDSGDYIFWHTTSVSGSVTKIIITFEYQIP